MEAADSSWTHLYFTRRRRLLVFPFKLAFHEPALLKLLQIRPPPKVAVVCFRVGAGFSG